MYCTSRTAKWWFFSFYLKTVWFCFETVVVNTRSFVADWLASDYATKAAAVWHFDTLKKLKDILYTYIIQKDFTQFGTRYQCIESTMVPNVNLTIEYVYIVPETRPGGQPMSNRFDGKIGIEHHSWLDASVSGTKLGKILGSIGWF